MIDARQVSPPVSRESTLGEWTGAPFITVPRCWHQYKVALMSVSALSVACFSSSGSNTAFAYERVSAAAIAAYAVRTAVFSAACGSTGTADDDATRRHRRGRLPVRRRPATPGRHQTEPHPKTRNP
ncbi:hypothetical protein ACQEVM_33385 [Streptomyces sp. CA-243310]|uniref:hypothetical protein n=1 Tax=Streptomyces sp. CA-243310 TaxID=3240056 RepID=UPI003D8FDBF5